MSSANTSGQVQPAPGVEAAVQRINFRFLNGLTPIMLELIRAELLTAAQPVQPTLTATQAAAPELLAALMLMIFDEHGNEWRDSNVDQGVWDDRYEQGKDIARAVIAKVTGVQS